MTFKPSLPVKCSSCNAPLRTPIVCVGCHTLHPRPQSVDHFTLFGLKRSFDVDPDRLNEAFRAIMREIHPDRFSRGGAEMTALSTRLSAEVNEAYAVLRDPYLRADYVLESAGGPGAAQERNVPGDTLMEVMELREELEEARTSDDRATLERLRASIQARRDETMATIAETIDRVDDAGDEAQREMRLRLNAVKYFNNLLEDLAEDPFESNSRKGV